MAVITADLKWAEKVKRALKNLESRYGPDGNPSVMVGYTANYALFVHENVEMKGKGLPRRPNPPHKGNYWDPAGRGQAKFLEQPFRELKNSGELIRLITTAINNGASLVHALYIAGLRIQRDSQKLVPVDFGVLKASAFTRKE